MTRMFNMKPVLLPRLLKTAIAFTLTHYHRLLPNLFGFCIIIIGFCFENGHDWYWYLCLKL